jgi:hypothetical protein
MEENEEVKGKISVKPLPRNYRGLEIHVQLEAT